MCAALGALQVVVDQLGTLYGCTPLDTPSAKWYQQLPLAAALRSKGLQARMNRCG